MSIRRRATILVLLVVTALGVVTLAEATIFNRQKELLCSREVYSTSYANYSGDWTIEDIARTSGVVVVGQPGKGKFVKHTRSGATCGTHGDSAILSFVLDFEVEEYVRGTGSDHITLVLTADRDHGSPVIRPSLPELVPGEKYLLILPQDVGSKYETRYGPDSYSFDGTPYNRWVIRGDVAIMDRGWQPEQVITVQDLVNRIVNACDSPIQPGFEKVVLEFQQCP